MLGEKVADDLMTSTSIRKRNVQTLDKPSSCCFINLLRPGAYQVIIIMIIIVIVMMMILKIVMVMMIILIIVVVKMQ